MILYKIFYKACQNVLFIFFSLIEVLYSLFKEFIDTVFKFKVDFLLKALIVFLRKNYMYIIFFFIKIKILRVINSKMPDIKAKSRNSNNKGFNNSGGRSSYVNNTNHIGGKAGNGPKNGCNSNAGNFKKSRENIDTASVATTSLTGFNSLSADNPDIQQQHNGKNWACFALLSSTDAKGGIHNLRQPNLT